MGGTFLLFSYPPVLAGLLSNPKSPESRCRFAMCNVYILVNVPKTSAVSSINERGDAHVCKLRDTPFFSFVHVR